ncbi:hypothetical protein EFV37_22195 [Mesorhizobium loti]|uniref:Uncharacterized protein n=1 Tax=Mesorhizobium jarvisii TaxID=1777867 RepID=A0A6M7TKE2_9HYPH|nr:MULTISPECIES: hypothetical protein [Mesorhizobium]OBQ59567.1 hypothetical protein A9K72_25480 [Mesorhizobium loti]QKC64696.1 hypothetical protein EB229_22190 [Mesorhizobium jarvisii]QKD10610.1 hypothetical protein EFV37_22195 [Mesorhizobium loti]RJT30600.1 hypothetical protein D3242_24825 [Mesorhizobium jarvisii]
MIAALFKAALSPAGKALGALLLAGSLLGGLYAFAYSSGRAAGRVEQLQDTVAAYEKRTGIDNETDSLGRVDLCVELGGLRDECEQLRGLDAAAQRQ